MQKVCYRLLHIKIEEYEKNFDDVIAIAIAYCSLCNGSRSESVN